MLTHGSLIRLVADYVFMALEGRGRVIVADAPQTDASFEAIRNLLALDTLKEHYENQGLEFEVLDLRREEWVNRGGVIVGRTKLAGDPRGYVSFDLAESSEFTGHDVTGRYYGADYDEDEVNRHHSGGRHEYLVSRTVIEADVVISLPKLKTHKKAGITVSLKNLVGINGDKNWLPHHTEGTPITGGDERPDGGSNERAIVTVARKTLLRIPVVGELLHRQARKTALKVFGSSSEVIRSGNWYGNDTIWRMCLDLNKVLLYGNPDGTFREDKPENRKRHLVLVDGLIAGEGNGPMDPDPVHAGMLVFGTNPASVDAACAVLMGFDPEKIPIIRQAFRCQHFPITEGSWRDVQLVSNKPEWNGLLPDISPEHTFHFRPHFGWKGHIERNAPSCCPR